MGSRCSGPRGAARSALGSPPRHPELIRGLILGSTWAWPDNRLKVRLFSALMGGPLSPLLVDRLNLMLRLYLPLNLKRAKLTDAEGAAYEGPFPPGRRGVMRVSPREIVAGRSYLAEVEAGLPLSGKPALILWPDSDPGFSDVELRRWQELLPGARTVGLARVGQFIDEDAPDDIASAVGAWWDEVVAPAGDSAARGGT